MRSEMQNWLSEVFGMDVILRPTTLGVAVGGDCYDYWTVSGLLADFVLVTPKPGVRNPSVLEVARLVLVLWREDVSGRRRRRCFLLDWRGR